MLPVVPRVIGDEGAVLRERIKFSEGRRERGVDYPDAPDYGSQFLFQKAWSWEKCREWYERDPEGFMGWMGKEPGRKEELAEWHRCAGEFKGMYPEEFEKRFKGSVYASDAVVMPEAEAGSSCTASPESEDGFFLPSPALSFPSTSSASGNVTPKGYRCPSDTDYSSIWAVDIGAAGVAADGAVVHAVASQRRWTDGPCGNTYLAHESCTPIFDYAHKKMAEIYQSQGMGYDEAEARFGVFGYDQRLYGPVLADEGAWGI